MSKETFSQKISEVLDKKIEAIESLDLKTLLEEDDNFEIAICLAYMSLSKEKIIDKDIKNNDRLGRLTQKVDTVEINKVFQLGFAKEMPKIIYARENNNLWILDNIRDSIMHGACDIDEERKCFVINNTQYNRELNAEIPFSWFVAYAKNDILSKKIASNYTMSGFYYNKFKVDKKQFDTNKELMNNILYKVDISGDNFNVREIEARINELFRTYAMDDISDKEIENYQEQASKEKIKYNDKYLTSFYLARKKVIEIIQKEFPNVTLKIQVNNRKYKLINKLSKKLPKHFNNYDLMFNMFNHKVTPKGISLLKVISNLCENIDSEQPLEEMNKFENNEWKKKKRILHKIITGETIPNDKKIDLSSTLNQDLNTMRSILLNVYGLSTLVINHETLYNSHFLNRHPYEFKIRAIHKRPYLDYASKCKTSIMKLLELEITLFTKQEQLSKCTNETAKQKIQANINDINEKMKNEKEVLNNLGNTIGFDPVIKNSHINYQKKDNLNMKINQYFSHFYAAKDIKTKQKIRKIIGKYLDKQIKEESEYTYGYCNEIQDVLTIIRNSFSHIGRITIGKNKGIETNIILNDYDTNGEKSAEVTCKYTDLIELLRNPYQNKNEKKQNSI